jgi:hypothetical protein
MMSSPPSRPTLWAGAVPLVCFFVLGTPYSLGAQEEVIPIIRGEVLAGSDPLPGAMVVLHEVSSEVSGEIDSIQAGADGTFELTLPRVPAHGVRSEVYFASVRHKGLLYFGIAITDPAQLDSLYVIQAFDTLSVAPGGATLPLTARTIFLDKVEGGWEATDFIQVRQEMDRTLFSPVDGVTWRYPLPPGAEEFEVGQSDLAPDAVLFQEGNLEFFAPIPPGERFFLVRYRLPHEEFTVPLPGPTDQMEILVREPGPEVEVPPLTRTAPVELEPGNVFKRYEGLNLIDAEIAGTVVEEPLQFRAEWVGLLVAAVLGGLGVFAFRLRRPQAGGGTPLDEPRERPEVLMAIARLDEAFEEEKDKGPDALARYSARRRELLRELERRT